MVKPVSGIEGWIDSKSPIQALVAGNNEKCKKLADSLQKEGFQINPILSPTVPKGKERLRICLHTFNNPGQIDLIMDILKKQC